MLQSKQWNGKENNFQNYFSVFTIFTNFGGKKRFHAVQICPIKQPARLGEPAQMVVNCVSQAGQLATELMMMRSQH